MITLEQIKSVMIGHAVGDALGVPMEFTSREYLRTQPVTYMMGRGTYAQVPLGCWSDDTSMSLCTLDSLTKNTVDYDDIMNNFAQWLFGAKYTSTGEVFDAGTTCCEAIKNYRSGKPALKCGIADVDANGNGSLMRIHPMSLYLYQSGMEITNATRIIHNTSALTHAHARSKIACGIYSYILWSLLCEPCKQSVVDGILFAASDYFVKQKYGQDFASDAIRNCLTLQSVTFGSSQAPKAEYVPACEDMVQSGGYVVDTLDAAVWCLMTTNSYEECVLKAVNLGRDTDTTAAVAGGLAGALYGYDAIPEQWKNDLAKREYIEAMCAQAFSAWTK